MKHLKYFLFLLLLTGSVVTAAAPADSAPGEPAASVTVATDTAATRTASAEKGTVQATVVLSPVRPHLSDEIQMTLSVVQPPAGHLVPPVFTDRYGHFQIVGETAPQTAIAGDTQTTTWSIQLRAEKSGTLTLPPIPLTVSLPDNPVANVPAADTSASGTSASGTSAPGTPAGNVTEKQVTLLVPPGKIEILSAYSDKIVSATDLTKPAGFAMIFPVLLVALIAGAVVLLIGMVLFLRRKRTAKEEEENKPTPRAVATAQLNELMESKIYQTDVKDFYLRMTAIVRWFIEEVTGVQAPEQTTEEFLREITGNYRHRERFDFELKSRLQHFLEFSDLVKFAKFRPTLEEIFSGFKSAQTVIEYEFDTTPEPNWPPLSIKLKETQKDLISIIQTGDKSNQTEVKQ